ncbi:hypothetical protein IGI04_016037, partial [Brassica rapa subsp. trilocularis]
YGDIFTNTLFINDQKTILALTLSLSLSRDPLFFISLSLDLFSSSLSPIHRRSTVSPPSPPSLTKAWISRLSSFSSYFLRFCDLGLLRNHTKALCLSAGAGHAPMAMAQIELSDVTAVELVDSLPLERRADPHNLHFSTVRLISRLLGILMMLCFRGGSWRRWRGRYLTHRFLQLRWSLHLRYIILFIAAKRNRLCNLRHKKKLKNVYKFCTILKLTTRYCDTSTELPDKPKLIIQRKEEFSEIENSHLVEVL